VTLFKPNLANVLRFAGLAFVLASAPAFAQDASAEAARALLPAAIRDAGTLNVGASTVYAPHSFFKEGTTEFTGYEIDLFNEVSAILGLTPTYTEAPFQQLIAGVNSGRSDVSLGDLGDNDLRREEVDFIDHTRLTFQLLIDEAEKDNIKTVFDLCGRELGVVQGTTNIIFKACSRQLSPNSPMPLPRIRPFSLVGCRAPTSRQPPLAVIRKRPACLPARS
jgi:polar amino acid transport system substrate-binding protein